MQNRYNRAVQYIRKKLEDGSLGKSLAARVIITWNRNDDYYLKSDWKGTWDKECLQTQRIIQAIYESARRKTNITL